MMFFPIYKNRLCAFTLLELMVVIAIISILAGLSAPTFTRQIAKAKLVEAQNLATQHQSLVEEFILINGKFPDETNFSQIKQTLQTDSIVKSISVSSQKKETGRLTLSFNNNTGINEGQFIRYSRDKNRNWQCQSNIDKKILPLQCSYVEE